MEHLFKFLMMLTAVVILLNGLDDLFIDVYYYVLQTYRFFFLRGKYKPLSEAQLKEKPQQRIAIMLPAWKESPVIAQMLRNTFETSDYDMFDVFVGTYPNDEETNLVVEGIVQENPRVHRIVLPHDGPTNKSDCLNWVVAGIRAHEKAAGVRFDIFILHDAEDLIHPLSFRLTNYLIPRVPMVQIPVLPFKVPLRQLTAGTYLDEFAQSHLKDLLVREHFCGMIPGAGVGTAVSRDALEKLAENHNNEVFNTETFTEDYDLAFRLHGLQSRSIILQFFIERAHIDPPNFFRKQPRTKVVRELVATRELFPNFFFSAIRQKSRWVLGIVFHGWTHQKWGQNWRVRYMLWRDRKAVLINFFDMLGYVVFIALLFGAGSSRNSQGVLTWNAAHGTLLWKLIVADALLLANRMFQRAYAVFRVAGLPHALLSIPRMAWGNLINCGAIFRATYQFVWSSVTGKKLVWAKTAHVFPNEAQLKSYRRKLGDLLLSKRLVTIAQLQEALREQSSGGRKLGEVLVGAGYISGEQLDGVLREQSAAAAK
ncbi:MAG: glycosyl transferase family protein [Elusimicrobia bacterium]|nr:glycosyl transferase family protein [Elusimicrobiota bacterium]